MGQKEGQSKRNGPTEKELGQEVGMGYLREGHRVTKWHPDS